MRKVKNMDRKVFLERCIDIFADYIAELNEISGYVITQEEQESFTQKISEVQELSAAAQEGIEIVLPRKMRYPLHQITCQLAQLATFSFHQIDMGKQVLVPHTVYHICLLYTSHKFASSSTSEL